MASFQFAALSSQREASRSACLGEATGSQGRTGPLLPQRGAFSSLLSQLARLRHVALVGRALGIVVFMHPEKMLPDVGEFERWLP